MWSGSKSGEEWLRTHPGKGSEDQKEALSGLEDMMPTVPSETTHGPFLSQYAIPMGGVWDDSSLDLLAGHFRGQDCVYLLKSIYR